MPDQRQRLLAGAEALVEAIQDVDELLRRLLDLLVPEFADLGTVDRFDDGALTPVVTTPDEDATRRVLDRVAPVDEVRPAPRRDTDPASGMAVIVSAIPGRFRGTPKVLRLARHAGTGPFDDDDLELVVRLGRQIGVEVGALRSARFAETAQQRADAAEARARRLQRLTTLLSAALTPAQVCEVTAEHLAAALDAAAVWLALFDTAGTDVELTHAIGVPAALRRDYARVSARDRSAVATAATTGEAIWFTSAQEALAAHPELEHVCPAVSSAALLPLTAGEQAVGGMGVCLERAGAFAAEERGEVLAIAGLCAQALARAMVYHATQRLAVTLQRSLLPDVPDVAGVRLYTCYLPAASGAHVGGDWYDVVPLDGDRVALVVGDVAGHGIGAATVMGQLRTGLRAYLLEGHEPAAALSRAQRLMDTVTTTLMTTVWCGILNPATGRLRYTNAGHLPPAVIGLAGEVGFLDDGRNPPLGVGWAGPFVSTEVTMQPAAVLVCYTDGLVESPGEHLDDGVARLAAALRQTAGKLDEFDEHVAPLPGEDRRDDVAILAVRRESAGTGDAGA